MDDDAHQETTTSLCTVCGEPHALASRALQGACLDCYLLNFAGALQFQPPSRERGELTALLRSREAMRRWANDEGA